MSKSSAAEGRAKGKTILLGEHAVVYGIPAIAVGIDRGTVATAEPASAGAGSSLELVSAADAGGAPLGGRTAATDDGTELGLAFGAVLRAAEVDAQVKVVARTELPAGAGLGCSAALGVAIVRALDAFRGRPEQPAASVVERALAWEKVFHGNPSGIDTAVAARGGCLLYQRTQAGSELRPVKLAAPLSFAIGHTGTASLTKTMVESVARFRERNPTAAQKSFEAIGVLVKNARLALEAGDRKALGQLMDLNQILLSGLLVSTETIETMCRLAREAGALGAKLTGAGGGGCVIALCDGNGDRVLASWAAAGFTGFTAQVAPDEPIRGAGA
jgi:mevalonate kinase